MDWLENDGIMRQWEEVSKEEGKTTIKRNEGRQIKAEGEQHVPELMSRADKEKRGMEGGGQVHRKGGG